MLCWEQAINRIEIGQITTETHFSLTFSKEDGETVEKQTRKTSVCKIKLCAFSPLLKSVRDQNFLSTKIAFYRIFYLGIWKWSKPVIVLLASRVKQAESVGFASDHYCHGVIVEHLEGRVSNYENFREVLCCSGWNVFLGPDVHSFGTWQVSFPVSKSIASRVNWAADIQGAPKHYFEHHWPYYPQHVILDTTFNV